MTPIHPLPPQVKVTLSHTLATIPTTLVDMIAAYAATQDFNHVHAYHFLFNQDGEVLNPELREAYKEAFMSAYCPPNVKSAIMQDVFDACLVDVATPLKDEFRKIFNEIADSGNRVIFDHVSLTHLVVENINWTGISLCFADLTDTDLIDVEMPGSDLTCLTTKNGEWSDVNVSGSNLSGTNLSDLLIIQTVNLTNVTGLENWPAPFVGHAVFPCPPVVNAVVAQSLGHLPSNARTIIADYMAQSDYSPVSKLDILFDEAGNITNPLVREGYKEALMSSYCGQQFKSVIMQNLFAPPSFREHERHRLEQEGIKIFREIAQSGHRAYLDDIALYGFTLRSLNWVGISIVGAELIDTDLIDVDMTDADARDLVVSGGNWVNVNLAYANLLGAERNNVRVVYSADQAETIQYRDME